MNLPALILASGASRRLGFPKQQALIQGETLLHRTARLALEAGFAPVFVVLGSGRGALEPLVVDLPVQVVANPDWEEGMASSIRAGLPRVPSTAEGLLLLVCDQVRLEKTVLEALKAAFLAVPERPAACTYDGIAGVPAIFPAADFPRLATLQGDKGARVLLRERPISSVIWLEGGVDLDDPNAMGAYIDTK